MSNYSGKTARRWERKRVAKERAARLQEPRTLVILAVAAAVVLVGVLAATWALTHRASTANFEPATLVRVSDGDTIVVRLATGEEGSVRLIGIDAPESVNPYPTQNTPEGAAAAAFVKDLLKPGQTLWLARDVSDTDKYGRWLRYVWLEVPADPRSLDEVREKMLQGIILDAGHAVAKRYTPDTAYATLFERIERQAGKAAKTASAGATDA